MIPVQARLFSGKGRSAAFILGPLVFSALMGGLIFYGWKPFGLPSLGIPGDAPFPGLWRWFFSGCLPALFTGFSFLHYGLALNSLETEGNAPWAHRALRADLGSYGLLPLFLVFLWAGKDWTGWRLSLGAFYLLILAAKTLFLTGVFYLESLSTLKSSGKELPKLQWFIFLIPLAFYVFLNLYIISSLSTSGDEHLYLLNTESLYADGDVQIDNNATQGDYKKFYWGRPSPALWRTQFLVFPALLLPGYALGEIILPAYPQAGRLGALLTLNLLAALLCWQVYRLSRQMGLSLPAALWAWIIVGFTYPLTISSGHIYPEIPAALAIIIGLRSVLKIPLNAWRHLGTVLGIAFFLVILKDRYLPLSAGLVVWALVRLAFRRFLMTWLIGVLLVLFSFVFFQVLKSQPFMFHHSGKFTLLGSLLTDWNSHMLIALGGLLADQEFGLFYYGPHWILALAGIPLWWRKNREYALGLTGLALFYLLTIMKFNWIQWDAGWTPPPRFMISIAPLLVPLIAGVFEWCRGRWLAAFNTLCLTWGFAYIFLTSLIPIWRFNNLDGRSTVIQVIGNSLGLNLCRFLPSLRAPTLVTWLELALGVITVLIISKIGGRTLPSPERGWSWNEVLIRPHQMLLLWTAVFGLWLGLAALVPTSSIEAEAMRHSGGVPFGSYQNQDILWVMKEDGEISEPLVTWPGPKEIEIIAAGYSTTGRSPSLRLFLDDRLVKEWEVKSGVREWNRQTYSAQVQTDFGRPRLRLEFKHLLNNKKADLIQQVYVDRIMIRPAP